MGFLCRDKIFLCRDRVWPRHEILGSDKVFSVAIEFGARAKRVYIAT